MSGDQTKFSGLDLTEHLTDRITYEKAKGRLSVAVRSITETTRAHVPRNNARVTSANENCKNQ